MQAEDVNSWSYLALQDPAYAARSAGSPEPGQQHGTVPRRQRVHLRPRRRLVRGHRPPGRRAASPAHPDDIRRAAGYLSDIRYAQAHGPNADGRGIIASSEDGLTDCQGDFLYASLHTGTTAWYILAAKAIDPLSAVPIVDQPVR